MELGEEDIDKIVRPKAIPKYAPLKETKKPAKAKTGKLYRFVV